MEITDYLQIFLPALSIILTISLFYISSNKKDLLEQLDDPVDRARLRQVLLSKDPIQAYHHSLQTHFNEPLEKIFGPALSSKALMRCMSFALAYPLFGLCLAWMLGAECSFGNNACPLPGDVPNGFERYWRGGVVIISMLVALLAGYLIVNSKERLARMTLWVLPASGMGLTRKALPLILLGLCFWLLNEMFIQTAFPLDGIIFLGLFGNGACLLLGASLADRDYTGYLLAFGFCMPFAGWFNGNNSVVIVGAVLGLLLPAINGAVDWLSLALTRFLISSNRRNSSGLRAIASITLRIFFDCVAAFLTLIMLVAATTLLVEITNSLFLKLTISHEPISIWHLIELARHEPLSRGLLVTLTLATTFFPTMAHLIVGCMGIAFALSPQSRRAGLLIPEDDTQHFSAGHRQSVAKTLTWQSIWLPPALATTLFIIGAFFWAISALIEPVGQLLADVAYCATVWLHDICPAPFTGEFPKLTPFSVDP